MQIFEASKICTFFYLHRYNKYYLCLVIIESFNHRGGIATSDRQTPFLGLCVLIEVVVVVHKADFFGNSSGGVTFENGRHDRTQATVTRCRRY